MQRNPQEREWDDQADEHNNWVAIEFGQSIQDLGDDERGQRVLDKAYDYPSRHFMLGLRSELNFRGGCPSRYTSIQYGC